VRNPALICELPTHIQGASDAPVMTMEGENRLTASMIFIYSTPRKNHRERL
jgi:hypothetical protein